MYFLESNKLKKHINYKDYIIKVNKSNIIKGLFDSFLYDILNDNINTTKITQFYESYIVLVKNKRNRSFPRRSNIPFTKWYIKKYSDSTKYIKIKEALDSNTINQLNGNLKSQSKKIISINDKKYK